MASRSRAAPATRVRPDAYAISDAQFIAGISVLGYVVATMNFSHGRLFWNFTYIADAIPDERARDLVDTCVALALDASENEMARFEDADA